MPKYRHPGHVGALLLSFALLWLGAHCHPNCVQPVGTAIFPPVPNPPLQYCSEYGNNSDGACCTATSEIPLVKAPAETLIDFSSTDPVIAACALQVKHIYCTWCNPYSGHNYESENGAGHLPAPWLCSTYCGRFWSACSAVALNTTGPASVGEGVRIPGLNGTMGVTRLVDHFASQDAYCSVYATSNPGSCYTDNPQELVTLPGGASIPIVLQRAYPNISFNGATVPLSNPAWSLHITHLLVAPGTTRMFCSFQHGVILSWDDTEATTSFNVVIDIQSSTYFDNGGGAEYGIMGVGFHPNFMQNGWMYVKHSHQTDRDRIIRYTVDRNTWIADPNSLLVLMDYQMFGVMHHGAPPIFAADGMMYVANGDGTNYFDNGKDYNPARDPASLLGKILRVNVDNSSTTAPYSIPADNPFVGVTGWTPEVWAYGFRNPWRFTYDATANRFWLGSVGQAMFEGVWVPQRGQYHGWHSREAYNCYWPNTSLINQPFTNCATPGEILPILEFPHDTSLCSISSIPAHCQFPALMGNAIIGGYAYRGTKNPSLYGTYIFANYQPNWEAYVYTVGYDQTNPFNIRFVWRLGFTFPTGYEQSTWSISTLGLDSQQEMLIVNINDPNAIMKFAPDGAAAPPTTPTPSSSPTAISPSTPSTATPLPDPPTSTPPSVAPSSSHPAFTAAPTATHPAAPGVAPNALTTQSSHADSLTFMKHAAGYAILAITLVIQYLI